MENFEDFSARSDQTARTVRVTLPASVAFNLDSFQEVQRSILDKLGCRACCSGWDIRFDLQRRFLVDEQLKIREVGAVGE